MLEGERQHDRAIVRVSVCLVAALMIIQKQFSDTTISVTTDRCGEFQPVEIEGKILGAASIAQAFAFFVRSGEVRVLLR